MDSWPKHPFHVPFGFEAMWFKWQHRNLEPLLSPKRLNRSRPLRLELGSPSDGDYRAEALHRFVAAFLSCGLLMASVGIAKRTLFGFTVCFSLPIG